MGCLQDWPRVRGTIVHRCTGRLEGMLHWPQMVAVLPWDDCLQHKGRPPHPNYTTWSARTGQQSTASAWWLDFQRYWCSVLWLLGQKGMRCLIAVLGRNEIWLWCLWLTDSSLISLSPLPQSLLGEQAINVCMRWYKYNTVIRTWKTLY